MIDNVLMSHSTDMIALHIVGYKPFPLLYRYITLLLIIKDSMLQKPCESLLQQQYIAELRYRPPVGIFIPPHHWGGRVA